MYVLEKKISADLFFGFKSHAPLKCWFQLSIQRASSTSAAYQVHTHASIFHILYITSTIFHYNWSISLKVIFLPLTCNGASSVSAPTDHYDGTGAIPRLVPRCANQRQPRHNQRSPDGRRTARCSEDQAHDHGGTVGKQRRVQLRSSCTSPAPAQLYRTLLLRAGNS